MTVTRRLRPVIAAVAFVLGIGLLMPAVASGAQLRFALVIGANQGQPDENPLLYAERDAERVAEVLVRLAGVPEENLLLLRGAHPGRVQQVLRGIKARIQFARGMGSATEALLFVYYSGHASVGALHLGPNRLPFKALRKAVAATGADVNVFVIDACRSGGLTRVKGAAPATPFEIKVEDKLESHGTAMITSSAAGEDAQESDRLKGGIFTHHLINGLRGAADASSDSRVTIGEAYRYAYAQTLRTTSRTRFVQHPTYSFKIKGRKQVTLTRIAATRGLGRLHLPTAGSYVILDSGRGGGVVAELDARAGTDVVLPIGSYLVRKRGRRAVHEGSVAIGDGDRVSLRTAAMRRLPYGRTVRRGLRDRSAISLNAAMATSQSVLSGQSTGMYGAVGGQLDLTGLSVQLRLRYGVSDASNSDLSMTQHMLGTDVGAFRMFDLPGIDLGVGLGVRVGGDWIMQRFTTLGSAPDRDQWVWRAAPVLRVEYAVHPRSTVGLDCGVDVYAMQVQRDRAAVWENPVVPFCALGWSVYLP